MMNFQQLREAKGYSQKKLARILGVNRATIANYERGKAEPKLSTCCRLATILEVSLEELAMAFGIAKVEKVEEDRELLEIQPDGQLLDETRESVEVREIKAQIIANHFNHPPASKKKRRKGEGTGFIEERIVNVRGRSYLQYWFHWQEYNRGRIKANSKYIRKHLVGIIIGKNARKVPVKQILAAL